MLKIKSFIPLQVQELLWGVNSKDFSNKSKQRLVMGLKKYQKGFTLIELLVVIAIIGVLSSIVLASLNTARDKGANAAIKGNLANIRAQAEIFYDSNGNYSGICATTGANTIGAGVLAAGKGYLSTMTTINAAISTAGTGSTATCHIKADNSAWAAESPLKGSTDTTPKMWCVDSTGAAKEKNAALAADISAC